MNIISSVLSWLTSHTAVVNAQSGSSLSYSGSVNQPNFLLLVRENINQLLFWGATAGVIILIVFLVSITRQLETWLDPILHRIKKFAPFIMQITLGTTLLLSAYQEAIFGVDLPLSNIFGDWSIIAQWLMYVSGVMLVAGIFPRMASFGVLILFIPILFVQEWQAVHHAAYLGEGVTILFFGGSYKLIHSQFEKALRLKRALGLHLHKYKFVLLRIAFGLSVIYASFYSRFLFNDNLVSVINNQNLGSALGMDAPFLLLALMLVEIGLGIFFIIGFEIRFAAIVYAILLIISMTVFDEAVWSHITLIGTSAAMFTHGYDRYTLGGHIFKRGNLEPIL